MQRTATRLAWSLLLGVLSVSLPLAATYWWRPHFYPSASPGGPGFWAQRIDYASGRKTHQKPYVESKTVLSPARDQVLRGERFSLKLQGMLTVSRPGPHTFKMEADDDAHFYVDGRRIINIHHQPGTARDEAQTWLLPGPHIIEVVFAQHQGPAQLGLWWKPPLSSWRAFPSSRLSPLALVPEHQAAWDLMVRSYQAMIPLAAAMLWLWTVFLVRVWLPGLDRGGAFSAAALLMALCLWLSSGTMAPYGAGSAKPQSLAPCGYMVNIDHDHFAATHQFLDGGPRDAWEFSLVLRRILHPTLAYFFMKLWGFLGGGFLTNILLHLTALAGWGAFLLRREGEKASVWGMLLLAAYPGAAYWAGLPYSYAMIVPASLWCFIILARLARPCSLRQVGGLSLLLGVLFLGYDLWPFFAPAAAFLVWRANRRWWWPLLPLVLGLLPLSLVLWWLFTLGIAPGGQNDQPMQIALGYMNPQDWAAWGVLLVKVPWLAVENFLAANFFLLPVVFLLFWFLGRKEGGGGVLPVEWALMASALAVFLFFNLAPPNSLGTYRGERVARFFQPIFVVLVYFICRRLAAAPGWSWPHWVGAAVLAFNLSVCLGPILGLGHASHIYHHFYIHAPEGDYYNRVLDEHGRRPLGICPSQERRP